MPRSTSPLFIEAEDFAFTWDEDGYASDINVILADLPADSMVSSVSIYFELDVEDTDFLQLLRLRARRLGHRMILPL